MARFAQLPLNRCQPLNPEWEYAARAKTATAYSFGDDAQDLCSYGNGGDQVAKTKHPEWTWLETATRGDDGDMKGWPPWVASNPILGVFTISMGMYGSGYGIDMRPIRPFLRRGTPGLTTQSQPG